MSTVVSVIIPSYNHAHYLACALESVLHQTFADWEAIVVDDGSTDNTRSVAAGFNDSRVHYIYQENQGLSAARNTGIRAAVGEYLTFLDADDEWHPSFLSTCVGALSRNRDPRIVGVYTSNVFMDETGRILPQAGVSVVPPHELRATQVVSRFSPPVHAVMIRADVVREVGMFDEALHAAEDLDLWLRVTRRYTLLGIPEPLARYRIYTGSMSSDAAKMYQNRMAVMSKHFGPEEGDPAQWSPDKRLAYSSRYRESAFAYMAQGEKETGWALLLRAACISPSVLTEQQTYYVMACLDQPRGYRGQVAGRDMSSTGAEILRDLQVHTVAADEPLRSLYRVARGSACLALAQLADQAGDWRLARGYMWQAFLASPGSLFTKSAVRRMVKLAMGKRLSTALRSLHS